MIKKISLVDQIYEKTRSDIINLEYPLGSRLSISNLQEKYNVSSTPVREALNRLQNEGLVEYENNVGAKVIQLTERDVMEIQQLAMVLHTAAIELSMNKGNNEVMAREIMKYISKYKSATTALERTNSVHNIIGVFYKYCENERLDNNMKFIQGQQLILRNLYGKNAFSENGNIDNFMEIYDGVFSGDIGRVTAALKDNQLRATSIILNSIKEY